MTAEIIKMDEFIDGDDGRALLAALATFEVSAKTHWLAMGWGWSAIKTAQEAIESGQPETCLESLTAIGNLLESLLLEIQDEARSHA